MKFIVNGLPFEMEECLFAKNGICLDKDFEFMCPRYYSNEYEWRKNRGVRNECLWLIEHDEYNN